MKLTKFEQSGFIIEATNGYKIALDIGAFTPVEKLKGLSIDAMLVSHLHGDHFSIDQIKALAPKKLYLNKECIELLGEEEISSEIIQVKIGDVVAIEGVRVSFFEVDHGPNVKVQPEENFGFLIEIDGEKIYFAGDIFYPSGVDVTELEVAYALIPVGGFYTFEPKEAFEFAAKFKHIDALVPMHYEKMPEKREEFIALAEAHGLHTESFLM